MTYRKAIREILNRYGLNVLFNRFFAFSFLSDYVGNDPYQSRLCKLLFVLSKDLDIVNIFNSNGFIDGRKILKEEYKKYKDTCDPNEYIDVINPISEYMFPSEFTSNKANNNNVNKAVIVRQTKKKKNSPIISLNSQKNLQNTPKNNKNNQNNVVKKVNGNIFKNIKNIYVESKSDIFEIEFSEKGKFELLVDDKEKTIDWAKYISNDSISLPIRCLNRSVILKIPKRKYDSLIIKTEGYFSTVTLDTGFNHMLFKDTIIKNKDGFVSVCINSYNLKVTSEEGTIDIFGEYNNVETNSKGDVSFYVGCHSKRVSVTVNTEKGKIKGEFINGRLKPPIWSPIKKIKTVNKVVTIKEIKISLLLNTSKGSIHIK